MPSRRTTPAVFALLVAMFLVAACLAPFVPSAPSLAATEAGDRVRYQPPVPGPVIDPFRPPATPYGPGNRGLDYRTKPGEAVRAAGPGLVIFAGQVAGRLAVVVLHADHLRTSYTGLSRVDVQRGQSVEGGQPLATAVDRLQFGVRAGTAYLDPAVLLDGGPSVVRLVPDR